MIDGILYFQYYMLRILQIVKRRKIFILSIYLNKNIKIWLFCHFYNNENRAFVLQELTQKKNKSHFN